MKRQTVKKLIQCVAIIAAGVLAIILFMLAIWYRGKNSEPVTDEQVAAQMQQAEPLVIETPEAATEGSIRVYDYDGCCIYSYYGKIRINSDGKDGKEIDVEALGYLEGYQEHKEESGRLLVYILADFVAVSEKAVEQDETAVRGVIANKPTYRETPRGKRITDITVKVRNELTGGSCFLPCICWQEQADEAAQWQQGDTVELLGRYQSRQYEKVLDTATGEREQRTAYGVSVRLIRRKEEAENEC